MGESMQVAVTGASGFVGRYVVRELLAAGHSVRALVRDRAKARAALPTGAAERLTIVDGDLLATGVADALLTGADACINLLGIIREVRGEPGHTPQTFQRVHVDATRLLVGKCEHLGVKRYVQMSALGVTDVGETEYQRTKFEAEMIVRLSSLDWTIFRPSLIHGREGEFVQMCKQWANGHKAPFIFMPYFTRLVEDKRVPLGAMQPVDPKVAPVSVNDVARALAACLSNPKTVGEVYNLVGGETMTWPEMLKIMRNHLPEAHPEQPVWGVPSNAAAMGAKIATMLGMGSLLPFDEGMARMGALDSTATLDKVREDFGFVPAGFRETFVAYAGSV